MKSEKIKKVFESMENSFPLKKFPISFIAGLFVIIGFWIFVGISLSLFPGVYNPLVNWMSDLGSSELNPQGAIFFNIGCIVCGLALFPFFFGLYEWYIGGPRNKRLTIATQVTGFMSAFAMMMIGVFPEDVLEIHIFWATILFTMTLLTFIFPSIALKEFTFTSYVAKYGFFAAGINLFLLIWIIPLLEWITIISSFIFIGIIIQSMYARLEKLRFVRRSGVVIPKKRKKKKKKKKKTKK